MTGLLFLTALAVLFFWVKYDSRKREFDKVVQQANDGDKSAQSDLAQRYYYGDGVAKDYQEALKWFKLAAETYLDAKCYVGYIYYHGEGVAQDYQEAIHWFKKAADNGSARANWSLGAMYSAGQGVSPDEIEAVKFFRLSAEEGFGYAQEALGLAYYNGGQGVQKDVSAAFEWFQKAANQGLCRSQFLLGEMYLRGIGVTFDNVQAHKWLSLCLKTNEKGSKFLADAAIFRYGIEKNMTSAQIEEAKKMAREFVPRANHCF